MKTALTDPRVVVALITIIGGIVVAYWQFVYRHKNGSASSKTESGNTANTVVQAPVINVSPMV